MCDCDILEASSIAIYGALQSTRVPRVKLVLDEKGEPSDFEIYSELSDATNFVMTGVPICLGVHKLGGALVLDAAHAEISCASSSFYFAFSSSGSCCGVLSTREGSFSGGELIRALAVRIHNNTLLFLLAHSLILIECSSRRTLPSCYLKTYKFNTIESVNVRHFRLMKRRQNGSACGAAFDKLL